MSQQQPPPDAIIWALSTAGFAARCLHVVADLGVADRIGDQPVTISELASSCAADPDALDRVLRLLAAHGIFEWQHGSYSHTPSSRLLRSDDPMTMRPFAQMMGLPLFWGSLAEFKHSVQTGKPAVEILEPKGAWAYLQERPDEAQIFGRGMTAKASVDVGAVIAAYDFTRFRRIADIGGGRGHLLRAILEAAPGAEGILFDLPMVIDTLNAGGQPRLTLHAGDFFVDALPSAESYILMEVLHDWADEQCVAILSAIRRAAPEGATVLVVEDLMPEERADPSASTLDIIMLTLTGGRERTVDQLSNLLDAAGFGFVRVIDTRSSMHIVEARPA
jgi:C-methyltransferase